MGVVATAFGRRRARASLRKNHPGPGPTDPPRANHARDDQSAPGLEVRSDNFPWWTYPPSAGR